jgi:hypothetical protein
MVYKRTYNWGGTTLWAIDDMPETLKGVRCQPRIDLVDDNLQHLEFGMTTLEAN